MTHKKLLSQPNYVANNSTANLPYLFPFSNRTHKDGGARKTVIEISGQIKSYTNLS